MRRTGPEEAPAAGLAQRLSRRLPAPLRPPLRRLHRLLAREIPAVAGHWLMRWRSPHQVLARWPHAGRVELGPRACIFAHWDAAGTVRPDVLGLLGALQRAGFGILFVTNAGSLRPEAEAALRNLCRGILVRRNSGYDFGAWREGLEQAGLAGDGTPVPLEMLLLTNDSLYGPFAPIEPLLARIDFANADLWGATDSPQIAPHLQSYWLAASPRLVASPAWHRFWRGVHPTGAKEWLVRAYEVGLSRRLRRAGFRLRPLFAYGDLIAQTPAPCDSPAAQAHAAWIRRAAGRGLVLNPTHHLWRQLLRAGFPFLKRELLRDNPARVPDLKEWRAEAARLGLAGLDAVAADLERQPPRR